MRDAESGLEDILSRLQHLHPKLMDLSLGRILRLLHTLGQPHHHLPPVVHVAGTNGKGSTLAFLRAILECRGWVVHMYTSPHLIDFNERIIVAGRSIDDQRLIDSLEYCERMNRNKQITFFEIVTAAAFLIFSQTPADVVLLETGLGGRLDATNVLSKPKVTAITGISFDHLQFLGTTIEEIALEKAGILKGQVPVVFAPQMFAKAKRVLEVQAELCKAPIYLWSVTPTPHGFVYHSRQRSVDLPFPKLVGPHQIFNAGVAIGCSEIVSDAKVTDEDLLCGICERVNWPGRLQRISQGNLRQRIPKHWELWIDGGHNDSAGSALAQQAQLWSHTQRPLPLYLIVAMSQHKDPYQFFLPLGKWITALYAVPLTTTSRAQGIEPEYLVQKARQVGVVQSMVQPSVEHALDDLRKHVNQSCRILICGSLYLIGSVLRSNKYENFLYEEGLSCFY